MEKNKENRSRASDRTATSRVDKLTTCSRLHLILLARTPTDPLFERAGTEKYAHHDHTIYTLPVHFAARRLCCWDNHTIKRMVANSDLFLSRFPPASTSSLAQTTRTGNGPPPQLSSASPRLTSPRARLHLLLPLPPHLLPPNHFRPFRHPMPLPSRSCRQPRLHFRWARRTCRTSLRHPLPPLPLLATTAPSASHRDRHCLQNRGRP